MRGERLGVCPTPILVESTAQGDAVGLRFYNRDIVTFRARVAGRSPAARVGAARNRLYGVLESGIDGEVVRRPSPAGIGLAYARSGPEAPLLLVTPLDVDTSLGATLESEARHGVPIPSRHCEREPPARPARSEA
jgi:hypothetical protein